MSYQPNYQTQNQQNSLAKTDYQGLGNLSDITDVHGKVKVIMKQQEALFALAVIYAKGGEAIPVQYRNHPEMIFLNFQKGVVELGMSAIESLNSIYVVNGHASMYGDGLWGKVLDSGLLEDWYEKKEGNKRIIMLKRKGFPREVVQELSLEEATMKKNKSGEKSVWRSDFERMWQMHLRSRAARDVFPDVLRGFVAREDIEDYMPERNITPEKSAESLAKVLDNETQSKPDETVIENPEVVESKPEPEPAKEEKQAKKLTKKPAKPASYVEIGNMITPYTAQIQDGKERAKKELEFLNQLFLNMAGRKPNELSEQEWNENLEFVKKNPGIIQACAQDLGLITLDDEPHQRPEPPAQTENQDQELF